MPPLSSTTAQALTDTSFASLAAEKVVDKRFITAIIDGMKFTHMTEVQAKTLPHLLTGRDILAQAKTGTGKTLSFGLPLLQNIVSRPTSEAKPEHPIKALILSPTRELASQIAEECERIAKLVPGIRIATAVGGNKKETEQNRIVKSPPQVLVATPGRLLDYLQDQYMRSMFADLQTLVLDEADRLLDAGFKREIDSIIAYLPDKKRVHRQTMLFSATVPPSVQEIAKKTLDANYDFISTVAPEEANSHERIPQRIITLPDEEPATLLPTSIALILSEIAPDPENFKAMVFLPTARQTGLFASAFRSLATQQKLPDVLEIHSRKSQSARTKAADAFSVAGSAILFSSDVTARGLDFPNVSHVIQLGLPASGEQYIHRLGRTGRAGKDGVGFIVLYPFEARIFNWFKEIKPLPIAPYTSLTVSPQHWEMAQTAIAATPEDERCMAYAAWIGYYKTHIGRMGWKPAELVHWANVMATSAWGLDEVPEMEARTVGKMGLKGVQGIRIASGARGGRGGRGGGRGAAGSRGGIHKTAGGREKENRPILRGGDVGAQNREEVFAPAETYPSSSAAATSAAYDAAPAPASRGGRGGRGGGRRPRRGGRGRGRGRGDAAV